MAKSGKILGLISAARRWVRFSSDISSEAQKINSFFDNLIEPYVNWLERLKGFLYDATLGLVKQYSETTLALAKIKAVQAYAQFVRLLRRQILAAVAVTFCAVLLAVALVVFPTAVILVLPVSYKIKLVVLGGMALVTIAVAAWTLSYLISEERWIKFTKVQQLIDEVLKDSPL